MVSKEKKDFFCLAEENKEKLYKIIYKELMRRYILTPKITKGKTQDEVLDTPLEIVVSDIFNYDYDGIPYQNFKDTQIVDELKNHFRWYSENIVFIREDKGSTSTFTPAAINSNEIGLPSYCISFNENHEMIISTSLRQIENLIQRTMKSNLKDKDITKPNPLDKITTIKDDITVSDCQELSRKNISIVLRIIIQSVLENYNDKCVIKVPFTYCGHYCELADYNIPAHSLISNYNESDWIYLCLRKSDGEGNTYYPVLKKEFMYSLQLLNCKYHIVENEDSHTPFSMYITIYPNKTMKSMASTIYSTYNDTSKHH